jgi:predicted nucleic acid-binding protein
LTLFVDTSAFYAVIDENDGEHQRALSALSSESLVTTDHVLVETWGLLKVRSSWHVADRFWSKMRAGLAMVETVLPSDLDIAWQIGQAFPDQGFSIVDRTSFAVMQRLRTNIVATFDDHFAIYRYGPTREKAFEIRR